MGLLEETSGMAANWWFSRNWWWISTERSVPARSYLTCIARIHSS